MNYWVRGRGGDRGYFSPEESQTRCAQTAIFFRKTPPAPAHKLNEKLSRKEDKKKRTRVFDRP
ncbi:MAG: hypothetical protein ABJ273_01530, partial [Marinobacter alexandrii]|uniref:hypothetical protein n=1 Tax=Marinobacter alexandrii TaxID=2570351 RepID=UPI0032979560